MTDIPIIFSAPMIRALLDGRKTMTRRLAWRLRDVSDNHTRTPTSWQKVKPGYQLWVREAAAYINNEEFGEPSYWQYRADTDGRCFAGGWPEEERGNPERPRWKPAIHIPRCASRLTLIVTATKIERLQDISEDDAESEGVYTGKDGDLGPLDISARVLFCDLWKKLHGDSAWAENPEVVALTFTVHKHNIDAMKEAE